MTESVGKAYKPWLIVSLVLLVGSLLVLAVVMTYAFVAFSNGSMPLWLELLGIVSGLGVIAGFGGFFALMLVAGWQAWREARRVQVIPPVRGE